MKKLYSFHWSRGRNGDLYGLFIADHLDMEALYGNELYFGEVLGRHSDVYGILEDDDIKCCSDDEDLINKLEKLFGNTMCGYNPFDYVDEEGE